MQFSIAYDVYLEILWCVNQRVAMALGQDSLDWCIQNSCPACQYSLEKEPSIVPSHLVAIDGNSSLHRVDSSITKGTQVLGDSRTTRTDLWLSCEQVDIFKDEVR